MEPIDVAFERFVHFVDEEFPKFQHTLLTEADVRMKIIDPIFAHVLGWTPVQIFTESQGGGYLDYRLTIDQLSRLIVEAKRDQRDLGIDADKAGRFFKLNGSVFHSPDAKEGINQSIRYCAYKNAELACVTNGRQWIIFRGNRLGDGRDTLDGMACVFGSLDAVKDQFKLFHELLSQDGVSDFVYRAHFQEAEGRPLQINLFKKAIREPNSARLLRPGKLYIDIDRVMISFFRNLSGDHDANLLAECFVTSSESDLAEHKLVRISEELYSRLRALRSQDGKELAAAIARVKEMQRNEFVLLVGTKGAGKSTFIDRFFKLTLAENLAKQCTIIRVNLADSEGDIPNVIRWLNDHFLQASEAAVFEAGYPQYEDIQAMFFDEYKRWAESSFRDLYEHDKIAFRVKFGEHVEKRREERPAEYVARLLRHVVQMRHRIPCLIFDNADHFSIEFQELVFQYARSLYEKELCLVLVPITDKTSWQLSRQGALQSFYSESLFLPTPSPRAVLERRISYLEKILSREKTESGIGYFVGRGIELSITNLTAFVNCLQGIFVRTGDVAQWIGNLANYDIRRCLDLTRDVVTSPHIKAEELLKAYINGSAMLVDSEDVKKALILGKYDIYPVGQHKFVQNIFALTTETSASPLSAMRILQFLYDAHHQDVDGESSYVSVNRVIDYLAVIGYDASVVSVWLDSMLKSGLCLSYDPTIISLDASSRIQLSPSGRQHRAWAMTDFVYLESMMEVCPITDQSMYQTIDELFIARPPGFQQKALTLFVKYLIDEDSKYCHIPSHMSYQTQLRLAGELLELIADDGPIIKRQGDRFRVRTGIIKRYDQDKKFGFIQMNGEGGEAFFHISQVLDTHRVKIGVGQRVEFELAMESRGPAAENMWIRE